jgi:hypothetical protein
MDNNFVLNATRAASGRHFVAVFGGIHSGDVSMLPSAGLGVAFTKIGSKNKNNKAIPVTGRGGL